MLLACTFLCLYLTAQFFPGKLVQTACVNSHTLPSSSPTTWLVWSVWMGARMQVHRDTALARPCCFVVRTPSLLSLGLTYLSLVCPSFSVSFTTISFHLCHSGGRPGTLNKVWMAVRWTREINQGWKGRWLEAYTLYFLYKVIPVNWAWCFNLWLWRPIRLFLPCNWATWPPGDKSLWSANLAQLCAQCRIGKGLHPQDT
jgi:hypothetical protein